MENLEDTIEEAKLELIDAIIDEDMNRNDACDRAHEIADSNTPAYDFELLDMAQDDMTLMLETPGIGSFETPLDMLRANVYERIYQGLDEVIDGGFLEELEICRTAISLEIKTFEEEWEEAKDEIGDDEVALGLKFTDLSDALAEKAGEIAYNEMYSFEEKVKEYLEKLVETFLDEFEK